MSYYSSAWVNEIIRCSAIFGVYYYFGVWQQFSISAEIVKVVLVASVVASVYRAATCPKTEEKIQEKKD